MINKNYLLDLAERAVSTYLESFFGLLLAANVFTGSTAGKATSLISTLELAAVSAAPAALAVLKGGVAGLFGKGDASALPAASDPTPTWVNPPAPDPAPAPAPTVPVDSLPPATPTVAPPAAPEIDLAAEVLAAKARWVALVQAFNAAPTPPVVEPPAGG